MKTIRLKYFLYLSTIIIMLHFGCQKDWFDIKSDLNQTVPVTIADFEFLLDNFLIMNLDGPGLAEVGSDGHYLLENTWTGSSLSPSERNAYIWSSTFAYASVADWNSSFKRIFYCNLVLDGLKKLNPNQEAEKYNRVKGNALFHRAKNYYDLAQIYAQPYQAGSASSDIGIPLKEGINVTEPAKRSSVKLIYDQILSDLHRAANLLPGVPELASRGSKAGAYALLARTYLTMSDYLNAGIYADSSLKLYSKLIDFNTIPSTATNLGRLNLETIFYTQRSTDWVSTTSTTTHGVDPELYALYENDDLRKTRFFLINGTRIIFKGNYTNSINSGFGGLAVDEQYLIRAECFARAGNIVAAMKDLNDLLKTRWNSAISYPMLTANDAEEALRKVLIERRKELLFRNLRWTDLRRLNMDSRFKTTLTRTIGGNTYTLEPGSYKYTLPIPNDVMNLAPQMKQTPGWE